MKTVKFSVLLGTLLLSLQTNALLAQSFNLLHSFSTNADGQFPKGMALCGNTLFGAAFQGDDGSGYDSGLVFSMGTDGSNYSILHSFAGADGQNPVGNPVISGGWIYGNTSGGGSNLDGVVYRVCTNGSNFTVLYSFDSGLGGMNPSSGLVLSGGTLYGTAAFSGTSNFFGSVFSICTNGNNFTILHVFTNLVGSEFPYMQASTGPVLLSGNTIYGVTYTGGSNNEGIVYSVCTNGSNFTVLHQCNITDGANPSGGLVLWSNTLYGATRIGGSNGNGTIFAMGTDGNNYRQIYAFQGYSNPCYPQGDLTVCSNTIYGMTANGPNGSLLGSVFSVNTDGSDFQVLYGFPAEGGIQGTNDAGSNPVGTLIVSGLNVYGLAEAGGINGVGTVYRLSLPPPPSTPPFFTGYVPLANSWNYLGTIGGNQYAFGYYSTLYFPYIYHNDLGWEYYIDAGNANHGAYFYDFASGVFLYTEPGIFPYMYDFNQNAWIFCAPQNGQIDRYQSGPRWFLNLSTQVWSNSP